MCRVCVCRAGYKLLTGRTEVSGIMPKNKCAKTYRTSRSFCLFHFVSVDLVALLPEDPHVHAHIIPRALRAFHVASPRPLTSRARKTLVGNQSVAPITHKQLYVNMPNKALRCVFFLRFGTVLPNRTPNHTASYVPGKILP